MFEKYIQIDGKGKGTIVVNISEEEDKIVLRTERNFHYGVAKKDFEKHYMLLSEWEKKNLNVEKKDKQIRGETPIKD
jgi:hypothetical protein